MIVIGLTGSIGMGKSATLGMFAARGAPTHDADTTVHALYRGEAAPLVEAAFPGVCQEGVVDRARLGARVIGDLEALRTLEAIVHPLVRAREAQFIATQRAAGLAVAVIDIPLLFETRDPARFDIVVVCSAAPAIQRARVLARPGMDVEKFNAILARQMSDGDKRRRAHYVIDTGAGFTQARAQVDALLRAMAGRRGRGDA